MYCYHINEKGLLCAGTYFTVGPDEDYDEHFEVHALLGKQSGNSEFDIKIRDMVDADDKDDSIYYLLTTTAKNNDNDIQNATRVKQVGDQIFWIATYGETRYNGSVLI